MNSADVIRRVQEAFLFNKWKRVEKFLWIRHVHECSNFKSESLTFIRGMKTFT